MERLFSYGTLRYPKVQLELFGRELKGVEAVLVGYRLSQVEIRDERVLAMSGERFHPVLVADESGQVEGMVFEITPQELERADAYEVDDYIRRRVEIEGDERGAWGYVSRD